VLSQLKEKIQGSAYSEIIKMIDLFEV